MLKTVYVTKYALTNGIEAKEVQWDDSVQFVYHGTYQQQYRMGRDAFLTEADAKKRAEEMRLAKIASYKKSIAKLEKVKF